MSDPFDFFTIAGHRRYLRIAFFLLKWAMRLLSATVETYLRKNFGLRYMPMLFGGFLFFVVCAGLKPVPRPLTALFLMGLFALLIYHVIYVFRRRLNSVPEPHSSSSGDSWEIWQRYGYAQTTIQRFLEPAFCVLVGLILSIVDPFLGGWLVASGLALFVKEQISWFKLARRMIDAMDAKIEAQRLNGTVTKFQQRPGQGAQKSHRAHFPPTRQRP